MVEQVDRLKGYRATGRECAIDLNFARVRHRLFLLEAWCVTGDPDLHHLEPPFK
jgi:hypothetical protein